MSPVIAMMFCTCEALQVLGERMECHEHANMEVHNVRDQEKKYTCADECGSVQHVWETKKHRGESEEGEEEEEEEAEKGEETAGAEKKKNQRKK